MLKNVFMLIKGLVIKKIESRLDCINIIADACKLIIMLRDKKKEQNSWIKIQDRKSLNV